MFEITKLSNGVKIVTEKMPYVRSVAFGIFVCNGSRNENEKTNGISHFIEHMLFKGTKKRSAKQIAYEMDAVGGQINAYTTKEYTCYYTKTLDTHFDTAIDILADMYFNSVFDENEIQKERNVILEEINMYEDTPDEVVYDDLQYNIWKGNSLGYSILGTKESISNFNHEIISNYYSENYCPQNTVIAVAGNIEKDDIINKISKYFANWKFENKYCPVIEKAVYNSCAIKKEKDIEQIHLCVSFPGTPLGTEESYSLSVFNTIFGGGMSSRLFQKIREENGYAYSVYSYNSNFRDNGLFTIYAGLNPSQTKDVLNLIFDEIKFIKENKISSDILEKTKEQIKSNFILGLENSSNRMSSNGRSQLLLNRILTNDELINKIENINADKIENLINKIFKPENASLSIVGRVNDLDVKNILDSLKDKLL